jgi:hypothetical protein
MISFRETLEQPQQPPSAQLKPSQPVQKVNSILDYNKQNFIPKPNLLQQGLSVAKKVGDNIVKGVNTVGKAIGQQGIINTPLGMPKLKAPTIKDVADTVLPKSPISNFASGAIEKMPQDFKENTHKLASDLKDKDKMLGAAIGMVDPLAGKGGSVVKTEGNDLIKRTVQALKEVKPLRKELESAYTLERTERIAKAQQAATEAGGGKAGFEAKLSQLKGALADQPKFEGLADKLEAKEIDELHNLIDTNTVISPYEKIAAGTGLNKLLTGRVPTESELGLLHDVYGRDFLEAATKNLTGWDKAKQVAGDVLNVPRALMSSGDVSAPLRQGVFAAARNPKEFGSAFVNQFKYLVSPKAYEELFTEIQSRPNYPKMRENKLALTSMGSQLSSREEAFMSNLAEKLPLGIGRVVRASDRAYSGFLNKFRADLFDKMIQSGEKLGVADNPKFLKDMTEFINNATGRGSLSDIPVVGKNLQSAGPLLNTVFFSPRLIASRVNLLNPTYYARLDPVVRKEAIKTLLTFTTTGMTILGAARLAGADVGTDPRSSDFGKIKVGNTRYDIWGGFQQYAKLIGQLITGESVNSTTGKVYSLGKGYKPTTRKDIIQRFFESKYGPIPSFANDVLRGTNAIGEPLDFTNPNPLENAIGQRFISFFIQDVNSTIKEYGEWGPVVSLPGLFGVGSQTYGNTKTAKKKVPVGTRVLP